MALPGVGGSGMQSPGRRTRERCKAGGERFPPPRPPPVVLYSPHAPLPGFRLSSRKDYPSALLSSRLIKPMVAHVETCIGLGLATQGGYADAGLLLKVKTYFCIPPTLFFLLCVSVSYIRSSFCFPFFPLRFFNLEFIFLKTILFFFFSFFFFFFSCLFLFSLPIAGFGLCVILFVPSTFAIRSFFPCLVVCAPSADISPA